jgi:site-specific DNA-methyltransferase (adenine-specific)
VLDPFAGIGTVGKAAAKLGRRFVLIEQNAEYADVIRTEAKLRADSSLLTREG